MNFALSGDSVLAPTQQWFYSNTCANTFSPSIFCEFVCSGMFLVITAELEICTCTSWSKAGTFEVLKINSHIVANVVTNQCFQGQILYYRKILLIVFFSKNDSSSVYCKATIHFRVHFAIRSFHAAFTIASANSFCRKKYLVIPKQNFLLWENPLTS